MPKPKSRMTWDALMERARQWDRDHAELMRDHAAFRQRLEAAQTNPPREAGSAQQAPARDQ